jgi:alkylation response protein AidB-like acyl-CoA dehydrogenase
LRAKRRAWREATCAGERFAGERVPRAIVARQDDVLSATAQETSPLRLCSVAAMNFELSEAQEILRQTVRRFLAESAPVSPYVRGQLEDPRGTTDAAWRGLADLGLLGLLVPDPLGGTGVGMVEMGLVCEELGRAIHPGPFASSALTAASLLANVGTESERRDLLPSIASGRTVATVALYEPDRRYDWRTPATEARESGDGLVLHGVKSLVGDVLAADLVLVVARDPRGAGLAVFAVDPRSEGVSLAASSSVDDTRKIGTLTLDGARARRLGAGDAAAAIETAVDRSAVGLAADALGAASRAHELALAYAKEREQFQRPIGSFQAVQHLLVDMLQDLELARAAIYYALWAADEAEPVERRRAAAVAKAFASGRLPAVGAAAIQIFGGVGFTWEYDVHLYYKRLLSMQAGFGDEQLHLDALASLVIDRSS